MSKKKISVSQIEEQLNAIHSAITQVAKWYRDNPDYTEDGRKSRYASALADKRFDYGGKLQKIAQLLDAMEPASQAQAATARAGVMPTAQDSTEQLAAELAASRILQRPGMQDTQKAIAYLRDAEPSPGLTVAAQELQERGIIDAETLDGVLKSKSPEYKAATEQAGRATQLAGFLKQRLAKTAEQMTSMTPVEMAYVPSVQSALKQGWSDDVTVDDVPFDAFAEVHVDLPYRSQ